MGERSKLEQLARVHAAAQMRVAYELESASPGITAIIESRLQIAYTTGYRDAMEAAIEIIKETR